MSLKMSKQARIVYDKLQRPYQRLLVTINAESKD